MSKLDRARLHTFLAGLFVLVLIVDFALLVFVSYLIVASYQVSDKPESFGGLLFLLAVYFGVVAGLPAALVTFLVRFAYKKTATQKKTAPNQPASRLTTFVDRFI